MLRYKLIGIYLVVVPFIWLPLQAALAPPPYEKDSPADFDNSSASYKNSPANYDNSSASFENSSANYDNTSASFDNSSANYGNTELGPQDSLYDKKGNVMGYIRKDSAGRNNIFDSSGNRIGYIGVDGEIYDTENNALGQAISRPGGGFSLSTGKADTSKNSSSAQ